MIRKTPFLGIVLMIVGFLLTPFIIGIPIALVGWLILIYTSFNSFVQKLKIFIPQTSSYVPYQPAVQSLFSICLSLLLYTIIIFGLMFACYYYFFFKPKL